MKALYRNIKALRQQKGLTQTEVAERLGYKDRSMLAKIEAGKVDITVEKVQAFADLFGVDPVDLMGWRADEGLQEIGLIYGQLNAEGQERLLEQAEMLCSMPKYNKKNHTNNAKEA